MRTKKMKHEKKKKKKIWNDFSFNLPVQLQEGNSSNRFSINWFQGGRDLFWIRNERFVNGYFALIDANLRLNKPWHRGRWESLPNTEKSSPLFSELPWDLEQSHVETWNFINSTPFYRFQNNPLEVTGRFAFGKFHKSTNTLQVTG